MRRCHWSEGADPELPRGWVPLAPLYHSAALDSRSQWAAGSRQRQEASLPLFHFPASRSFSRRPLAGSADSCYSHPWPLSRVPPGYLEGTSPELRVAPPCTVHGRTQRVSSDCSIRASARATLKKRAAVPAADHSSYHDSLAWACRAPELLEPWALGRGSVHMLAQPSPGCLLQLRHR